LKIIPIRLLQTKAVDLTSPRKAETNRQNARKSSGPKSETGKARSARNARRHGLAVSLWSDTRLVAGIEDLARDIAGERASDEERALARRIAEAHVDLVRIRQARHNLLQSGLSEEDFSVTEIITMQQLRERDEKHLPLTQRLMQAMDRMAFGLMPNELNFPVFSEVLAKRLDTMDRYEHRAISRRNSAIRQFDTARILATEKR
jgi:hypothetical protein